MDELADSRSLADDPAALRARLAADGYVFLRGLLPADPVRAAGERVAETLRAGGWTAAGSPRLSPGAGPLEALADPSYRAAVTSLAFNALPYLASLRATVRRILGPGAFSYPVKVLRAVAPESLSDADQRPLHPLRLPGGGSPGHADHLDPAGRRPGRARRPRRAARRPPGAARARRACCPAASAAGPAPTTAPGT